MSLFQYHSLNDVLTITIRQGMKGKEIIDIFLRHISECNDSTRLRLLTKAFDLCTNLKGWSRETGQYHDDIFYGDSSNALCYPCFIVVYIDQFKKMEYHFTPLPGFNASCDRPKPTMKITWDNYPRTDLQKYIAKF